MRNNLDKQWFGLFFILEKNSQTQTVQFPQCKQLLTAHRLFFFLGGKDKTKWNSEKGGGGMLPLLHEAASPHSSLVKQMEESTHSRTPMFPESCLHWTHISQKSNVNIPSTDSTDTSVTISSLKQYDFGKTSSGNATTNCIARVWRQFHLFVLNSSGI